MKKYLISYFVLIILLMPNDFFSIFSLYVFNSPPEIKYEWLIVDFSAVFIPFLGIFLLLKKNYTTKKLLILISIICFLDIIKLLYYDNSYLISNFNFELYYGYLFGLSLFGIIDSKMISIKKEFYETLMKLNIVSIFLFSLIYSPNRANIINMDFNSSGFFILFYMIYNFIEGKQKLALISFIALILTGSRINLVLSLFFICLFLFKNILDTKMFSQRKILFNVIFVIIFIAFSIFVFNTIDLSRLLNFTSNISSISEDSSVVGRILSIVTSFEAIKMFPFGVNFSFIDQQIVMQNLGYPTFPHSYFLSFYLVSGLVSIYFLYVITKYLFKSTKKWKPLFILIFIYFLIGDGLFVNFKIFFMVFLIIGIINDRKEEILVTK